MDIVIDFDGTCVTHEYPRIGKDIGAIPVLKKLIEKGHNLIMFTMRSGKHLTEAVEWLGSNGITLYGIQYNPEQTKWTSSNKCYGQLYIDDAALGCPLTNNLIPFLEEDFLKEYGYSSFLSPPDEHGLCFYSPRRPYVNWIKVEQMLIEKQIL